MKLLILEILLIFGRLKITRSKTTAPIMKNTLIMKNTSILNDTSLLNNTSIMNDASLMNDISYDIESSIVNIITYPEYLMPYIAGGNQDPEKMKYIIYMVSIRSRYPQKYFGDNHFCGGTIIGPKVVLTSAHCVMDKRRVTTRARRLLLIAGTPNRLEAINTTVQFPARIVKPNTNFIRNNRDDIALIHLKAQIPEDNNRIKILQMPKEPPPYGNRCTILGWGRIIKKGPLAALPLHVDVKLFTSEDCEKFLGEHYYDGILCAGGRTFRNENPCRGDSGGPLICNNVLTGVISWTTGCGTTGVPSIYTSVWHNRKWIEQHINTGSRIFKQIYLILIMDILMML